MGYSRKKSTPTDGWRAEILAGGSKSFGNQGGSAGGGLDLKSRKSLNSDWRLILLFKKKTFSFTEI